MFCVLWDAFLRDGLKMVFVMIVPDYLLWVGSPDRVYASGGVVLFGMWDVECVYLMEYMSAVMSLLYISLSQSRM